MVDALVLGISTSGCVGSSPTMGTTTPVVKLVDALDLRSSDPKGRAGSSPARSTKNIRLSTNQLDLLKKIFLVDSNKSITFALQMKRMQHIQIANAGRNTVEIKDPAVSMGVTCSFR